MGPTPPVVYNFGVNPPILSKEHHELKPDDAYYLRRPFLLYKSFLTFPGASLIRMMNHFLTNDVFKRGLSKYLKRHKFSSTEQDDLWAALTEQAHEDMVMSKNMSVKTIMDTWTLQTGFPVINVKRDYNNGKAVLNQARIKLI